MGSTFSKSQSKRKTTYEILMLCGNCIHFHTTVVRKYAARNALLPGSTLPFERSQRVASTINKVFTISPKRSFWGACNRGIVANKYRNIQHFMRPHHKRRIQFLFMSFPAFPSFLCFFFSVIEQAFHSLDNSESLNGNLLAMHSNLWGIET